MTGKAGGRPSSTKTGGGPASASSKAVKGDNNKKANSKAAA